MLRNTVLSFSTPKDLKYFIADILSRLNRKDDKTTSEDKAFEPFLTRSTQLHITPPNSVEHNSYSMNDDHETVNCFCDLPEGKQLENLFMLEESFLNVLDVADNGSPLDFVETKREQLKDPELVKAQTRDPKMCF